MARNTVRQMADMRALEEEARHTNPLSGRGATPSMGLSQIRGGKKSRKASEAYEQGAHLANHLSQLHGGSYCSDFHAGMGAGMSGGGPVSSILGLLGLGDGEEPVYGAGTGGAGAGTGGMRHHKGGVKTGAYEGEGKLTITHGGAGAGVGAGIFSDLLGSLGLGRAKKEKRPVGPNDGRRKRAEIVKRVQKERGCDMIEASKYVKEHNLYHP